MSKNEANKGAAAAAATGNASAIANAEAAAGATFVSKSPNFKIYLKSPVPVPGANGAVEYKGGVSVQFINHRYSTSDPAIIDGLRKAKSFNVQFQEFKPQPAAAPAA